MYCYSKPRGGKMYNYACMSLGYDVLQRLGVWLVANLSARCGEFDDIPAMWCLCWSLRRGYPSFL